MERTAEPRRKLAQDGGGPQCLRQVVQTLSEDDVALELGALLSRSFEPLEGAVCIFKTCLTASAVHSLALQNVEHAARRAVRKARSSHASKLHANVLAVPRMRWLVEEKC